jgi:hypothetical protein
MTLPTVVPILLLLCGGCGRDDAVGKYVVVDIEHTLDGIKDLPIGLSSPTTLQEYRQQIKNRYADKTLELTSERPHEFLVSVPLQGTVGGLFTGGWMRDQKDKSVILIYKWVSGSVYTLEGQATLSPGLMTLALDGTNAPVLHFKKLN